MFPRFTIPRMLSKDEERRLLATVRAQGCRRDVALLTLALGTGLRLRELRGLNVGNVRVDGDATAWKVILDPATTKGNRPGVAYLTGQVRQEMGRFLKWKVRAGEATEPRSPLFVSRQKRRLSPSADSVHIPGMAGGRGLRGDLPLPRATAYGDHERL
jgi:site-specific recombinase XerC